MCGFCGFVDKNNSQDKNKIIDKMMNRIKHRGPDESGKHVNEDIALGFQRLSIIDVNSGSQPIYNEDQSKVIVFNGEIYNYIELKEELERLGHKFKTKSDTEVILHGFEEYGADILVKLRGMYSFIIWDEIKKEVFGARDIFGIKPLYYATMENAFMFSSEIKSFLEHPDFKKDINPQALKPYLSFQYSVLNETFFKNVFKLEPCHYFIYSNNELIIKKYYDIKFQLQENNLDFFTNKIHEKMIDSVNHHLVSDVEVGAFLSGGIDSSYIVGLSKPQKTFSIGFSLENFNETKYSKELSDKLGLNFFGSTLSPEECFEAFSDIQYYADEPQSNPSTLPLYFLSKNASQKVKVVLSGEGADELFGGYDIYDQINKYNYDEIPKVNNQLFIGEEYIFSEREACSILKPKYHQAPTINDIIMPIYNEVRELDNCTKMQYLDIKLWLPGDILLKADKMTMAHSLELRVPFLDREVLQMAMTMPSRYRINDINKKYALRIASKKSLPTEWSKREKKPFPSPIKYWLKEEKFYQKVKRVFESDFAEEFFDVEKIMLLLNRHFYTNENHFRKIWVIYTFLVWYERFFIKESSVYE